MESTSTVDLGAYKHVLLVKFREDVSQEKLHEMLQKFSALQSLIPKMKSFHWGKDESTKIKHKGYTHIIETTFDSIDDISSYYDHPSHSAFASEIMPLIQDYIVVNYKPMAVVCN